MTMTGFGSVSVRMTSSELIKSPDRGYSHRGPSSLRRFPATARCRPARQAAPRWVATFVLLFVVTHALPALAEKVEELNPRGYVNDFADVLPPGNGPESPQRRLRRGAALSDRAGCRRHRCGPWRPPHDTW